MFMAVAAVLAVGVTRPGTASSLAELVVAFAIVAVVVEAVRSEIPVTGDGVSLPFVPADAPPAPSIETPDVSELLRLIAQSKGSTPAPIARHIREIARGRLADHHRLDVERRADHAAIERLLSPTLSAIVTTDDINALGIPIRALPQLLDELETL